MVTKHSVDEQLKKIHFNLHGWGRTEINELPNVLLPDEEIYECVNGIYEGGFALLVATDLRVLLIDKKPLNYLTVEDMRFEMINEIDYSHRLVGANISISTGYKDLKFTSFNQYRLRKLIGHVQHCMAESKKKQSEHQEDQKLHLEQINRQLQTYLLAQHQQQQKMQEQLQAGRQPAIEPVRPNPELSDYLYARSLLAQHKQQTGQDLTDSWSGAAADGPAIPPIEQLRQAASPVAGAQNAREGVSTAPSSRPPAAELYAEGLQEVFGGRHQASLAPAAATTTYQSPAENGSATSDTSSPAADNSSSRIAPLQFAGHAVQHALEINPLRIAYSRLPMTMRNRRLGSPSFHVRNETAGAEPVDIAANTEVAPARP